MTPTSADRSLPSLLVAVPTSLERRLLEPRLAGDRRLRLVEIGFGPIAAAAATAEALSVWQPTSAVLVGIAGSFDAGAVGTACFFRRCGIEGIGAGEGTAHRSAAALGFPQAVGAATSRAAGDGREILSLTVPSGRPSADLLLTVCSASATAAEAAERRRRWPEAAAEDMEAFGFALACRRRGVSAAVVRGLSNGVGDRDVGHWRIAPAVEAAAELLAAAVEDLAPAYRGEEFSA